MGDLRGGLVPQSGSGVAEDLQALGGVDEGEEAKAADSVPRSGRDDGRGWWRGWRGLRVPRLPARRAPDHRPLSLHQSLPKSDGGEEQAGRGTEFNAQRTRLLAFQQVFLFL